MNYKGEMEIEGIHYHFEKRANRFLQIPFSTHHWVADGKPDLVLVQGFIFPLQVMTLRKKTGKHPIILLQHHGEVPGGKKTIFQKLADKQIDGYLFSAIGNAQPWLKAGIIRDALKCFELPSSSTSFIKKDKSSCRAITGMDNGIHFLWVGRLNANKDPFTVLKGFEKYCMQGGEGRLWMIYSEEDLVKEIKSIISGSDDLAARVHLVGKIPNSEMETWYNAADYFISGSWQEGGSYALTEAMACGCIPVVTRIPPAMKTIKDGEYGYFYEAGNVGELTQVLLQLKNHDRESLSVKIAEYFKKELSAEAVAEKLMGIYYDLLGRRKI
jgi:glycosyltransferase involved in cell wall biosynthesis